MQNAAANVGRASQYFHARKGQGADPFLTMPVKALKDWPMLESEGDMKSPARRVRPCPLASSYSKKRVISYKDQWLGV